MPENKQLAVAPLPLPVPDDVLVRRVQAGNTEAFEELVRRYERKVYNITYRLMGNEQDASEALQDAFMRAFRFIGKFQFKSSFFTWLYRIATNNALQYLRRKKLFSAILFNHLRKSSVSTGDNTFDRVFENIALKEAKRQGNESAEVGIKTFDSSFYIPELLTEIKEQNPILN
jgi:RNA polymerase sigma factor (sigma-70 family)